MSYAIEAEDLTFRYLKNGKRNILDHTTLSIQEGSLTLIMGSSGSGKSTLAAVLAGLYPENGGHLEGGQIRLFGQPLSAMDPQERAKYLTILFQNPSLQFCMDSLREEMRFCMENICIPPEEMDEKIEACAQKLGIESLLDRKLHSLSGGEQQRAALACLYLLGSKCILLDESLVNLDEKAQRQLRDQLLQMKNEGRTILVIDHKADLWMEHADEVILLSEGAKVHKRGICRENMEDFRKDFEELGLFFPGEAYHRKKEEKLLLEKSLRLVQSMDTAGNFDVNTDKEFTEDDKECPLKDKEAILALRDFSIRAGLPRKKGWRKQIYDSPFLLEEAKAVFPKGAMTAILGESGRGKSTTFMSILRQHPYKGRILFEGKDLSQLSEKELYQRIGIVFQNPAKQFVSQSVEEEVLTSLRIWKPKEGEEVRKAEAMELLERYGLKKLHRFSPYMLSQGQQRRLAVLSVLAGGQKLLLLDEPTYGQDERSVNAIMEHLSEKVEKEGMSVIFITHDRQLAKAWADKIYLLEEKKLTETEREVL